MRALVQPSATCPSLLLPHSLSAQKWILRSVHGLICAARHHNSLHHTITPLTSAVEKPSPVTAEVLHLPVDVSTMPSLVSEAGVVMDQAGGGEGALLELLNLELWNRSRRPEPAGGKLVISTTLLAVWYRL